MSVVALKKPDAFGQQIADLYLEQGFQSLSKRDLDLLIFILLELDGALDKKWDNYKVAQLLRITPQKAKLLRRDAYARWRPLVSENRREALREILSGILTVQNIKAGAKYASEKTKKDGFLAVRIEHPADRVEFEQAVLEVGAIPVYERNRDVIDVSFDTLLRIAEKYEFIAKEPEAIRDALEALAPQTQDIEGFLKTPVTELTWAEARKALNDVGAKFVRGAAGDSLGTLFKLVFPFLP